MRHSLSELVLTAVLTLGCIGCSPKPEQQQAKQPDSAAPQVEAPPAQNRLTATDSAAGWRLLVDGSMPTQWRAYKKQDVPSAWHVQDGVLSKELGTEDLISRDQFGDFELTFDWKIAPGGNAGVFYRGTEGYDHIYWSAPEYQLLDDAGHPDGKDRLTSAGAAYAVYPSPAGSVKPGGQWNSSRIVAKGAHVEHWLNGTKVVDYEMWSPDWKAKVKASKFSAYPKYGLAKRGYIGIQGDHQGALEIRNMRIRELK